MWGLDLLTNIALMIGLAPLPFAIVATIVLLFLLFSPIDLMPEILLGPIGLADDVVYVGLLVFIWGSYFSWAFLATWFNSNPVIGGIAMFIFVMIAVVFLRKATGKIGIRSRRKEPYMLSWKRKPIVAGPTYDAGGYTTTWNDPVTYTFASLFKFLKSILRRNRRR